MKKADDVIHVACSTVNSDAAGVSTWRLRRRGLGTQCGRFLSRGRLVVVVGVGGFRCKAAPNLLNPMPPSFFETINSNSARRMMDFRIPSLKETNEHAHALANFIISLHIAKRQVDDRRTLNALYEAEGKW